MRSPGQPPPAGSIVVREGKVRDIEEVLEEAWADRAEREDGGSWNGVYHLSVFAGLPENGEELAETVVRLFGGHRTVRWFRVAQLDTLLGKGFEVGASEPEPYHYDVGLGEVLNHAVVADFEGCFGREIRNRSCKRHL